MMFTPTPTTRMPLIAPAEVPTATAMMDASVTFIPCSTLSTGTIVAQRPRMAATDRSTNSPTMIVQSRAIDRNTSAACDPKIVLNVPEVPKSAGSIAQ